MPGDPACRNDRLTADPQGSGAARGRVSCWAFGDIAFTRTSYANAPARRWRHLQRSFMDHGASCSHVLAMQARTRSPWTDAHSLSFRSLALPFTGEAQDTELLTLFLPRDSCRASLRISSGRMVVTSTLTGAVLAGDMERSRKATAAFSREHADGLAAATRALVAACIAPRAERFEAAEAPIASLLIDRACLVVKQNMVSAEFGPKQLARLMAMSRSKLYRLFESTGGVAHFINRERLRKAYRRWDRPAMLVRFASSAIRWASPIIRRSAGHSDVNSAIARPTHGSGALRSCLRNRSALWSTTQRYLTRPAR